MTIERAIHIVKNRACSECDSSNSDWNCAECDEALSLAIKGLEMLTEQPKIRMFVDSHGDIHPLNKEEIICCKDCEHYSNGICFVSNDPRYRRSDFYCGDARKREE